MREGAAAARRSGCRRVGRTGGRATRVGGVRACAANAQQAMEAGDGASEAREQAGAVGARGRERAERAGVGYRRGGAGGGLTAVRSGLLGPALRGAWQTKQWQTLGYDTHCCEGPGPAPMCVAPARLHVPAGQASSARRVGLVRGALMQSDFLCACAGRPNEAVMANVPDNTGIGQCANHHFTTVVWRPMSSCHSTGKP